MELREEDYLKLWLQAGYTEEEAKVLAKDSLINTNDITEISAEDASGYLTQLIKERYETKKIEDKIKIGMINKNSFGTDMKIIKIISCEKVVIQFQDEHKYEKEIFWNNFKRGTVKNPYDRIILGHGYIGVGKYKATVKGRITDQYNTWSNIILRCYSDKHRYLFKAYPDCEICEEWCNFQVFAKWYDENFYPIEGRLHIDKDVLVKGNKIYSPDTCLLLPQRINMIFMEKPKTRDADLPNTIYRCKSGFQASYNGKSLGVFKTVEDAITAHDNTMRIHIKEVAEEYKNIVPNKVYDALLRW